MFPDDFTKQLIEARKHLSLAVESVSFKTKGMQGVLSLLRNSLNAFYEKAPESFRLLAKYGWYMDLEMIPRVPIMLSNDLLNGEIIEVDRFLSDYYEKRIEQIKDNLLSHHPSRKKILEEGFWNHLKANYFASISLLLTQVDGICFDKSKRLFFQNNKGLSRQNIYKPEVEEYISQEIGDVLDPFLTPICEPTAINEHSSNLGDFPIRLNRHEILHGIDFDYGKKINSLKIISLINSVDQLLSGIKDV